MFGGAMMIDDRLRLLSRLPQRRPDNAGPIRLGAADRMSGRITVKAAAPRPGLTGLHLLPDIHGAFAARILPARAAERTLDLQYYIWHGDRTGTLMLAVIQAAAARDAVVRLLFDNNGISMLDTMLPTLDHHPNTQVRLFNPFRICLPKRSGISPISTDSTG